MYGSTTAFTAAELLLLLPDLVARDHDEALEVEARREESRRLREREEGVCPCCGQNYDGSP